MKDQTRSVAIGWLEAPDEREIPECAALVIAWSATQPQRVGEIALLEDPDEALMLGRGEADPGEEQERLQFARHRPGQVIPAPPLDEPAISRDQLLLKPVAGGIEVERVGRCPVMIAGAPVGRGVVRFGETLALKHQLVLYCCRRPVQLPALLSYPTEGLHVFGEPDRHGIVGESPAAWELRDELAFCGGADAHVLLLGESGSGKELAAAAVHGLSVRRDQQIVSRNAATFPEGIIDAELFGNVKDYPNPGMEARRGVIGEADGSSLFLDEIAELAPRLQAHLLRVLDAGGEYQRLGDAHARKADLRLIAATNRDPADLKHDLLARFSLRVRLPGLDDRREDIPLIVRQLLLRAALKSPPIRQRFFQDDEPRVDPDLIEALLRHHHSHHVRELDSMLWRAISGSKGRYIALTEAVKAMLSIDPLEERAPESGELSAEVIVESLQRHDGKVARAYKELGLKSRYALYRLMKKHDIEGA